MKKCAEKEVLFDFYHKTLPKDQLDEISKHIEKCKSCQRAILLLSENILLIKDSLDYINPAFKEIPEFRIPLNNIRKKKKISYSRILSIAAGICLLVTISALSIVKIAHFQKPVNDYEFLDYVPDMNDAWKGQTIVVTSYDKNGNPTNRQVLEN